ncbi:kelch repeat-containing protein [Dehalobacter sp. TBBPA1]|uniref:Kelch repeat-containing protein n=1 Tax=Dehalobacter sp. TBBPA1 TaxID=3235037 RepID=UPI0034A4D27A
MFNLRKRKIFSRITAVFIAVLFIGSNLPINVSYAVAQIDGQKVSTTPEAFAFQQTPLTLGSPINNKTIASAAAGSSAGISSNNGLTQAEIDKIVNAHFNYQSNKSQNNTVQLSKPATNQQVPDDLQPDNQQYDRFIVKYKDEKQKENTYNKIKGSLKQRKLTKNKKFDVYITTEKMKKENMVSLLKQKQVDSNIEYIQPDYQLTVASEDSSQSGGTDQSGQSGNSGQTSDTTSQAPTLSNLSCDGLKITLTYSETLSNSSIPSVQDFTATTTDGTNIAISTIAIADNTVVITLSSPQAAGENILLSYTPGTKPIQDTTGNPAQNFSGQQVTSSLAQTATVLVSAQAADNKITLQFSNTLDTTSVPAVSDFAVAIQNEKGNPVTNSIKSIDIDSQTVTLTLAKNLLAGQTVQLNYTSWNNPLKDQAGNPISGFSDENVTNQTAIALPQLQEATIIADQLELDFSKELKADSNLAKGDFSLTVNNNIITNPFKSLAINGEKVTLVLNKSVVMEDQVQISYTPGTNPLQDTEGNKADAISGFTVDNQTVMDVNDTFFNQEWGLLSNIIDTVTNLVKSIGANVVKAWSQSQGDGVTVAVIDTGIDITHSDLKHNIWANTKEVAGNSTDDDNNGYIDDIHGWNFVDNTNSVYSSAEAPDDWHGTHMAGIIAAEMGNKLGIAGVAPKVKIMPLQVFKNGTAYTSDIINAIDYVKNNGAQIVNCSWGTTSDNTALKEAIENSGLLFVCAAGNSNQNIDSSPVYPAAYNLDNVISVASLNQSGNLSHFSNYGNSSVDVAAPGENIYSTLSGNTYGQSSGTSQAAAFVTGEAALILSKYPNTNNSDIKQRIISSCDQLSSLTGKVASGGIIDCAAALADPIVPSDTVIQVQEDTTSDQGTGSSDNGGYNLYSVNEWNTNGSLSTARRDLGTVSFNNKVYCVGGYNGSYLNSTEVYDPAANLSTTAGSLNTARYGLAVAATDSKIYAIGGYYSGGYTNKAEVYDTTTNIWSYVANMPTARDYLGAATVNGIIYVIGGLNGSALSTVEAYDPSTNTWTTKASMPTARYGLGVVAYNGKIYAIGGYNSTYVNTVEVYDPVTNTWTTKASLPVACRYFGIAAISGSIYVMGGYNGSYLNSTYQYDPNADTWGARANLSAGKYGLAAAAVNEKIYAFGGYYSGYLNTVEEYGLPSSKWTVLNNMTTARSDLGAAAVNGKVYAIGGYDGSTYLSTVEQYDQTTNSWSTMASMSTVRKGLGVTSYNGLIYAVGGYNGSSYLKTLEVFNPITNTWITKASMSTARAYLGLTVVNGKLYAIGGYNGTSYINTVEEYDPVANTWTTKANMTTARGYLGLTSVNGKVYAIGGYNGSTYLNTVQVFDPFANTWTSKNAMITARRGLGVESVSGIIYAIGGYNGSYLNIVEQFDPSTNNWTALSKENMFNSRERFGMTSLDGKIYVIGGYNGSYIKTSESYNVTTSSWKTLPSMPVKRQNLGVVAVNGKIYAIGGSDENSSTCQTVEVYDPVSGLWTAKTNMPAARSQFGIAALAGKIYVFGGLDSGNTPTATVEVYDTVADTWSTKANMPFLAEGFAVTSLSGEIYTMGGYLRDEQGYINELYQYDPATDTWTQKTGMWISRAYLSASSVNGKIYAIGGKDYNQNICPTVEKYDPVTDSWNQVADMPAASENFGCTTANGKIYALGGDYGKTYAMGEGYYGYSLNSFEEYDPSSDSWITKENMPIASSGLGIAEVNGKLYAFGGNNVEISNCLNAVQVYDLGMIPWQTKSSMITARKDFGITEDNNTIYCIGGNSGSGYLSLGEKYNSDTDTWSSIANMPTARDGLGLVDVNNKIYAIGGYNGSYLKTAQVYDPIANTWSSAANMNAARTYFGTAAVNGKIYAIGGYNGSNVLNTVEVYDPSTNTWTNKANMPAARYGMTVTVVNNKIYVMGGYTSSYVTVNTVEVYDPATDTWSTITNMPTLRSYMNAGTVNGKIHVIGGFKWNNIYLDTNEVYDPASNGWSVVSSMPTARGNLGIVSINNKLYAIGGVRYSGSTTVLNTVEVYDPNLDSYKVSVSNSVPRSSLGVAELDGRIYAVGGFDGSNVLSTSEVYGNNNQWSSLVSMPTARKDLGLAAVNGKLYAIGGNNGTSYLSTVEQYDTQTGTWSTKTAMPTARSKFGITVVSGKIYVIGGYNGTSLNTVEEYNPDTDTWITKANMPIARHAIGLTNVNGFIYAIGGQNSVILNTAEKYDPISNTWASITNMPTARCGLGLAVYGGNIYAIGGYDGSNYLSIAEEYNPVNNTWTVKRSSINPRAYFGAEAYGDYIFLIGGCNSSGLLNANEEYYPGTITWTERSQMPNSRFEPSVVELNGNIYVIGGLGTTENILNSMDVYDPDADTWSSKAPMLSPRFAFGTAVVNGKIYAIGGFDYSGFSNTVEMYDPVTDTWTYKANMPTARANLGVTVDNGIIYAIAGNSGNWQYNSVEAYDPTTDSWSTKASLSSMRYNFGVTTANGKIYIMGGYDPSNNIVINTVEVYDPLIDTWTAQANIPTSRSDLGAVTINGKIYAVGGEDTDGKSLDNVEVYDPSTNTWHEDANLPIKMNGFGITSSDKKIYVFGGNPDLQKVLMGSFDDQQSVDSVSELIHMGEENVNPSGNFARTYTDMTEKTAGFSIDLSRTYNSRDTRTGSQLGTGWNFGFQGSLMNYQTNQVIARLPNGSAMTFTVNGSTYTANDSRSTLIKQGDGSYILTTKDQYTYGFTSIGWLNWMKDRNGNTITLTVNSTNGNVTLIKDQINRQTTIHYNSNGYIDLITDPAGRTVHYYYDSNNQLIKVTDPAGKNKNYVYNSDGLLSEVHDNDNNLIESVVYDNSAGKSNIRIARLTDAYGNTGTYMYDTDERKVTVTDTNGQEKIIWYDSCLYPIQTQDPDGRRSTTLYNLDTNGVNKYGEIQSVTDRNGNKTEYTRDSNGNITVQYNPDSSSKTYGYDSKSNKIWEKDEGDQVNTTGKYTYYIYDSNNINLLKKAQRLADSSTPEQYIPGTNDADFAVTNYAYYTAAQAQSQFGCNIAGLLQTVTDPNGHITTYTYDSNGFIHTVTDGEGKTTTYSNNNIGWKMSETSAKGNVTSYVYDQNGNLEKETLQGEDTSITRTTYDNVGRKTKEVNPNQYNPALDNLENHTYSGDQGYRYTYYPSGKVESETDPEGNITTYTYDLYGNIQTETKPNGSIIEYYHDNLNRLSAVKFKENSTAASIILSSYSYLILTDGKTQKTEIRYLDDTETAVTQYTYDYKNRLVRQDNPDGTYTTITYNLNGTIASSMDVRGYSTYYRYDGLNQNTEQWIPVKLESGNTLYTYKSFTYDKAGNIVTEKTGKTTVDLYQVPASGDYITLTKEYYNNNNLKSETDSAGHKNEYQYDDDSNVSKVDNYTSTTAKNTTEYVNNYLGKPVQEKCHVRQGDLYSNAFNSDTDTTLITSYTYDKNGNILTQTRPDNVTITYTYDNLDRMISTSMPGVDENNDTVTITTSTTYDWADKVLTQTDANNHTVTNTFDKRERLIKVTDAQGHSAAYYYDRAGRLTAEISPQNYDPAKTLSEMSRTEYTYDNMDRVKTKSYTYLDPVTSQWVTYVAKAYQYDANGNVIKELDALGYEAGTGSTVEEKIASGYGTEYTYDPANRVLTVLDPVSKQRSLTYSTLYSYDGAGRKVAETNANGVITSYTYDDAGNLLTTQIDNQTIQTNTYDLADNLLTQTDGNGNTVTYTYNAFNKLKQAIYSGDSTIPAITYSYQYYKNGNLKKKFSDHGDVELYTYDNQGRELSQTKEKSDGTQSITISSHYDKAGNLRFAVDGNGITTENIYDENNRIIQSKITVTDANGTDQLHTTGYGYDADGNQTSKTDWLGNIYTNIYDPLGRLIEKKDPLNKTIERLEYNHNSIQIKSYDALNKLTEFTYDRNNRLLSKIDPLNHATSQTYDNVSNIHTKTDGLGNVTTYNYDEFNRLISVVNTKNETTSYTYDLNGNKLTQTDGANHTITFEYNIANKVTRKIDHGGRTGTPGNYTYDPTKIESYTYDAYGNLLTKVDRNADTTTYTYDIHNRMLSQTTGTLTISFTYDGNNNQLIMTDSAGTTTRTYDQLNRTKTKEVPNIGTLTFLYDITTDLPAGQAAETDTDPKGNTTTYVYDQAGRMISVTAQGNTTNYTYYDNGSKHTVLYPDGSSETYTYCDDNSLHTLVNTKPDQTIIDSYTYTYDAAHNLTSKVDAKGTTTYTYDELNRLETITEPSTKVTTYTFDEAGNRLTQTESIGTTSIITTYTYNDQNRLTNTQTGQDNVTTETVAYTYDNNGNQLTVTKVPYVNGIPQSAQVTQYTYDKFNQLITTSLPDGTNLTSTYNGEGLRVAKQVNSTTTKYVYVGDKVVLELDGSNNQVARNIQGTSLIAREVDGMTLYYMYNGHADVTALIDATGTVQATYYYDAFGNILEQTGTVDNPFTYAGYQYDDESGLYYLNSRYYDPVTARFLSEDTYYGDPNDPLSLNLYTYCHNEPIMYSDPTGHWSLWGALTSAVSTVKSAATSAVSTVTKAATKVVSTVTKAASTVVSTVSKAATTAVSTVSKAATTVASTVSKAASTAVSTASKAVSTAVSTVTSVAKSTAAIASSAISSAASAVKSAASSIASTVSSSYSYSSSSSSRSSSRNSSSTVSQVKTVVKDFITGVSESVANNLSFGASESLISNVQLPNSTAYYVGKLVGDTGSMLAGAGIVTGGVGGEIGGVALDATGVGALAGVPINVASAAAIVYGGGVVGKSAYSFGQDASDLFVNASSNRPQSQTPEGAGRNGAFREAKRNSDISVSQQPETVKPAVDKRGNQIPGKDYDFGNGKVIRDHSEGHEFPDDPTQNRGPHFNDIYGNHYDYNK